MLRRPWLPLVVAFSTAFAVIGCEKPHDIGGKTPSFIPHAIVSLSPSTTEIISGLCGSRFLVAGTAEDNYPRIYIKNEDIVVKGFKPDYEKLAELQPDLIVYDAALYGPSDVEKIKQVFAGSHDGAEHVFVWDPKSLADYFDQAMRLSALTQTETTTSGKLDEIQQLISQFAGDPINPRPTIAIIDPGPGGQDLICGTKGFLADVVDKCGGTLVGPVGDKFVPLNFESLVKFNPKFIMAAGDSNLLAKDARFAVLDAVKNNRLFGITDDVVLRRGARVDQLMKALHQQLAHR